MARKQDPLTIEYLLLGIIRQKPIHAYDLDKLLNEREELNIIWRFNQSQLYAILEKLEKNHLIESTLEPGAAYPFRKVYVLTEHGEDSFQEWKIKPVDKSRSLRSEFLAKLYFLNDDPLNTFESVLFRQIELCEGWVTALERRLKSVDGESAYIRMVLQFRLENLNAAVAWLKECLEIRRGLE